VCGTIEHPSAEVQERMSELPSIETAALIQKAARLVGDHKYLNPNCLIDGCQYLMIEALVKEELTRLRRIEAVARSYVDIRSNHPQIAGEAWRELVKAVEGDRR
jgi:hypothetical protein